MATANFTVAPDNTSDATFRVWTQALHDAIAAILTFVTQTGEINFGTVLTPSATSQKRGFRIYRFSDAAQVTHPIFIRIDFGSGTGAATQPGIWVQAGNAVDGSGNLSVVSGGNLMTAEQLTPAKAGSATTFLSHVSGDGGRLTISLFTLWMTTAENTWFFNIERCPDSLGNYEDNAVGLDILAGSNKQCYTLTKDGRSVSSKINSNSFMPWPFDDSTTTAALGLRVGCFPFLRISPSRVYNAITGCLIYHDADYVGIGNELISVYGSNKTYYLTQRGLAIIASASSVHRVAVRND